MTYFLYRRWKMLPLILLPLLVSLACNGLTGGSAAGTQAAGSQTPEAAVAVKADVVFGPGAFSLPKTKAGLADLSSYKATLTLAFDGTQDGKTQKWSKTYVMMTTKEPAARQFTIEKAGDLADLEPVYMAEADGAAYERIGKNACNATVIDPSRSLAAWMEPADLLTGVLGAEAAGSGTVNDIAVDHYTFDQRALGQQDVTESTGEIWVATQGGYLVKYVLTSKGDAKYFGEGVIGTISFDYELTNLNKPVTFDLPADCPAGMVNAPQLPDATNVVSMPGVLTYDTPTSLADVAAFYQKQLPTLGWKLQHKPDISETTAVLDYQQGGENMSIIVKANASVTTINILLERSQK